MQYLSVTLAGGTTSWIALFDGGWVPAINFDNAAALPSFTQRADVTNTNKLVGWDSAATVSSWGGASQTVSGGIDHGWVTWSIEIEDIPQNSAAAWSVQPFAGTLAYSNSGKTATSNNIGFSATSGCLSVLPHVVATNARYYAEFTSVAGQHDGNLTFGICDAARADYAGLDDNGVWHDSVAGIISSILPSYTAGDTIGLAVNLSDSVTGTPLVWWKNITQGGYWNLVSTDVPDTPTPSGGVACSAIIPTGGYAYLYVYATNFISGTFEGGTLNTGATAFAGTIPAGYTAWYAGGPATYPVTTPVATSGATGLAKAAAKIFGVSTASALAFVRSTSRAIVIAGNSIIRNGNLSTKTITATTVSAVSNVTTKFRAVLLAITTTSAVSLLAKIPRVVTMSISSLSTIAMRNAVGKVPAVPAASSISAGRAISRSIPVAAFSAIAAAVTQSLHRTYSVASTSVVSAQKTALRSLSMSGASAVSMSRAAARALLISGNSAVAAVENVNRLVKIALSSFASVAWQLSAGKRPAIQSASAISLSNGVKKLTPVAVLSAIATVKAAARSLTLTGHGNTVIAAGKVWALGIIVASASSVEFARSRPLRRSH
jgi:hypothetical protein